MIDIHSHILYGVDDGPSGIEQSLRMVGEAEKLGIKIIIATPHFQDNLFKSEKLAENYQNLMVKAADYNVTVKLGYEVFISPFIPGTFQFKRLLTLGNSRYMLIEFPFDGIPIYSKEVIYQLQLEDIIPVIAHPERNRSFHRNFDSFVKFIEKGCLIQVDAGSILGVYGSPAKEFSKKLIKLNMAHFVASDAHCADDYKDWYLKAFKKVKQWAGENYAEKLYFKNAKNIIDNAEECIYNMI